MNGHIGATDLNSRQRGRISPIKRMMKDPQMPILIPEGNS